MMTSKPEPEEFKPTLNPILRSFWLQPARNRVLYGGRSSSKSWDAAGFAIYLANMCKVKFLCTRQYQNKIEESVYSLLKVQIERFGLEHRFEVLKNKIINRATGSEFLFYGLWRHIDEIKSLEGVDVCWIEEAHNLTAAQWEILEPTVRKEGSQFWIIFNPRLVSDFVYQHFVVNPDSETIVRKINYTENPFLSGTILKVINRLKEKDPEEFKHIYLGEPRSDDDQVVIKRSWIEAAIDAHIKLDIDPTGERVIGYDVADDGQDTNATTRRHGILVEDVDEWKGLEDQLMESCGRVHSSAVRYKAAIVYDSIGVGASCGSKFKELNELELLKKDYVRYYKYNAGSAVLEPDEEYQPNVTNKDFFLNLKAQAWWTVADRLRHTYEAVVKGATPDPEMIISISSECNLLEKLITELSTPRRTFNANGKVQVERKEDMRKRDVKSPNIADSFVSAFAPKDVNEVDYQSLNRW